MPSYIVTDKETGKKVRLTGDSPPSEAEIAEIFSGLDQSQPAGRDINKPLQFFQKLAQGATFGFGDEISAAMVGATAALTGGEFKDAYSFALDKIRKDEQAFSEQNPKLAMGAEIVGAVTTGGLGGARALGGSTLRNASLAGRAGRVAAVGAAEGGLYGAGTATEGERLEGAAKGGAIGAVAAPIGAAVINGVLKGGKTFASYAGRKLADTPRSEAIRAVRAAALSEGIDADDALRMLDELGPNATLADLGENFRFLARAATDQAGQFKSQARNLMDSRQMGQQDRILQAAEVAAGQKAGNFKQARTDLIQGRKAASQPLYQQAFEQGMEETDRLKELMDRPALKAAIRKSASMAKNEGLEDVPDNLLTRLHYAKMNLDDMIGAAKRAGGKNQVRILTKLQHDLLDEIDNQVPAYKEAREIFSGDSRMLDAMDTGRDFLKLSPDDLDEALAGMSASERDLYKLGAVRALKDKLDTTGETHDATKRLLNTKAMRQKLATVFDDPDSFIRSAGREVEFTRTRNVLTGGSPTAERLAGQESLGGAIQPEVITSLLTGDVRSAAGALIKIFSKNKVTPELVEELAGLMLKQGQTPDQIRKIFATPALAQRLGPVYDQVVLPGIAGAVVPAAQAAQ